MKRETTWRKVRNQKSELRTSADRYGGCLLHPSTGEPAMKYLLSAIILPSGAVAMTTPVQADDFPDRFRDRFQD